MIRQGQPPVLSARMQSMLNRLHEDAEGILGARPLEIVPESCQVRESSEVARVRVVTPSGMHIVFAKIFRPRPGEADTGQALTRFRRDCSVTRHVSDAMKSLPDLRAVEPIVWYEDLLGVITNEAPGRPLSLAISRDARWPREESRLAALELAVSRVGRWIAAFQRIASEPSASAVSLDASRDYIDARLQKLTALPRAAFSQDDRRDVVALFDRSAAAVGNNDLTEVAVHGDIVPSNVMADADRVTVLDFGMTARGSRYLDIARLYTQLEFYAAKPQYRPETIARLQASALEGFEAGLRADNPLFEIAAVQHVVCHLLSHVRQPGSFPASLYSAHQCRRHRRWLQVRARASAAAAHAGAGSIR